MANKIPCKRLKTKFSGQVLGLILFLSVSFLLSTITIDLYSFVQYKHKYGIKSLRTSETIQSQEDTYIAPHVVRFCKVVPYHRSKLYGIVNVQKSISRWKGKRNYLGEESKVPYRQRRSLQVCRLNRTNADFLSNLVHFRQKAIQHSHDFLYNFRETGREKLFGLLTSPVPKFNIPKCNQSISFAFAISSQEGSGKIRGFMMADELNKLGHTAVTVFGKEGPLWPTPLQEIQTCPKVHVCIFVKWDSRSFPRILRECKNLGALNFIDLLDYCDTNRKNVVDEWPMEINGFILQSNFQLQIFKNLGYFNSVVIRHHHTNHRKIVQPRTGQMKVIGFTGSRKNSGGNINKFLEEIELWGKDKNIKIVRIVSTRMEGRRVKADVYDQSKYHTGEIDAVDVALIWPKDYSNSEIYFKPITRLIHWLSHGIPTIVFPTQSYIEIAQEFGYPLLANTTSDVIKWLEVLLHDRTLRIQVSQKGLELAQKYSLKTRALRYSNIFCEQVQLLKTSEV